MKSASAWSSEGSSADRPRGLLSRSRTDTLDGDITTVTESFRYDDELRLIESVVDSGGLFGADTETFTLDPVGNRTAHSEVLGEWSYNVNNQLTDKGILLDATDYDPAGNLIRKAEIGRTTHYRYDTRNRLIEVKDGDGNPIARYGYDPFDRRIWKEQYRDKDGNTLNPAKRSYYLYADEGLIAEANQDIALLPLPPEEGGGEGISASTPPVLVAQYGPKPDSEFTTGTLFVKTRNSNGQDNVGYYQHDHLQTPIQATDKTGRVIWSAQYNAFGRATLSTPTTADKPAIRSDLRLPGQVEDEETGLHYNWHRYYDPEVGRYVTADPIGLDGGINFYPYVGNNPISAVDPLGLKGMYCTRPLGDYTGQNGGGWPIIRHEFICVTRPDGTLKCDSTNNRDGDRNPLIPDPAEPSKTDRDNPNTASCKNIDDDKDRCFEDCVIEEWRKLRPPYAIGPLGIDCQEYSQAIVFSCRTQCQ